jgi:hypothetical protein
LYQALVLLLSSGCVAHLYGITLFSEIPNNKTQITKIKASMKIFNN